jgi:hypothetical protein
VSSPKSFEDQLLQPANVRLEELLGEGDAGDHGLRVEILEGASARLGGFDLDAYRDTDEAQRNLSVQDALIHGDALIEVLRPIGVHPALILASLAREPLTLSEQRKVGAYYTDFRLAQYLAQGAMGAFQPGDLVIDPASGTGILLVAAALQAGDKEAISDFVAVSAHAADLSETALRGVKLALASLTNDLDVIHALSKRLRVADSLVAGRDGWSNMAPGGFHVVIGNPPWEKLKVTRHEHLSAAGVKRHYGDDYSEHDVAGIEAAREKMAHYARQTGGNYELHGGGELDLYKLFTALAIDLAAEDGRIAYLVPAGLIRSQGTEKLRRHLFENSASLEIAISDNKARYFSIDTRFKFLALQAQLDSGHQTPHQPLKLDHVAWVAPSIKPVGRAIIGRRVLKRLRPDLTVPEVRSIDEWNLFRKAAEASGGVKPWELEIVREVDMTRDRKLFLAQAGSTRSLPLIEGRMVHQFRRASKSYISGTGRSARWDVEPIGTSQANPQFYVELADLPVEIQRLTKRDRVGFCDITGQTNERTMFAARIPGGRACGNKVPTVTFEEETGVGPRSWLWLAIVNSFAFDWLLRRLITTSVNYFLLRSVPMPPIGPGDPEAIRVIELAQELDRAYHREGARPQEIALLRAELDARIFAAYGFDRADVELVFEDFSLLDRGQVPLPGESRATITRDLTLQAFLTITDEESESRVDRRIADALLLEAQAYIPAELAKQSNASARRVKSE